MFIFTLKDLIIPISNYNSGKMTKWLSDDFEI